MTCEALNSPLAGGAYNSPPPLANFLNSLKTSADVYAKTYRTWYSINLTYSHDISAKSVGFFIFRKWRFSDMSRDFGSKNGQISMNSRMYSFEAKHKQKTP